MKRHLVTAAALCCVFGGCASTGESPEAYTQTELNAIETREVDATLASSFDAASGALFDAGYTISMSDRAAGLLTGTKGVDRSTERFWVSPLIMDTRFVISVKMRQLTPIRTEVRIKSSVNGEPKVDKAAIDQIWVLMQRQVMMKTPFGAPVTGAAGAAK